MDLGGSLTSVTVKRRVPAGHYAYALLFSLIAFVMQYVLRNTLDPGPRYVAFFFSVMAAAAIGGLWPGLVATGLGLIFAIPFHGMEDGRIHITDPGDPPAIFRFLLVAISICAICESLIRSRERAMRAETLMRESEERFRLIANSAPVMIWLSGTDKLCSWFNDPWLKYRGRTMEQEMGNGWADGVHPQDLHRCLETYTANFDAHLPFTMEYRLQDKDRNWRWVLDRGIPRYGPNQEFLGYIGSCIEIEDMKRAEQALQWANADLEQFAFSASHDLREPIRNIAIHSELIAHRFEHLVDADGRKSLDYVIQGARRLDTLVGDLLKYTTISKVEDPVETVDSEAALGASLEAMATLIRESGAEVTHGPLPKLRIREVHLQQLFQNMLGNALKYRGVAPPRIHINAVRTDHFWQVAVADNGIGIEPRHQQSIFGLFKRLHRAEKYTGTGLGLAICQRIVHLYGGQIWVDSADGKGATFFFTLPGAEDSLPLQRTVA